MNTIYQPYKMRILEVKDETQDVKTFKLAFDDPTIGDKFAFKAGQFGEFSVFGEGEATFCIASSPTRRGYIECSVKSIGKVTEELHKMCVGDIIGFRGPYGNFFPIEKMEKRDLIFIGGGIGL
ncbi:MAG: FAD-binding oxidoreductase, partial [bacterium]